MDTFDLLAFECSHIQIGQLFKEMHECVFFLTVGSTNYDFW